MSSLFATPGMILESTMVFVLEIVSLFVMTIGLLSYRHIVKSHRSFFASLHHDGKLAKRKPVRALIWIYFLSTLILVAITSAIFIGQFRPL